MLTGKPMQILKNGCNVVRRRNAADEINTNSKYSREGNNYKEGGNY